VKQLGAGVAVAALYGFIAWLIQFVEANNGGGGLAGIGFLILIAFALAATWKLVKQAGAEGPNNSTVGAHK
jgi:hypothetical protein